MKIQNIFRYIPQSLPWVAVIVTGILLLLQHTDFLYRAQEQSLFLPTEQFFREAAMKPGGMLTYAAAFLTQFFYYPVLGVGILVLLWAVSVYLLMKGARLEKGEAGMLTLVPISLYSVISQIGYSIFYIKLQGLLVAPTIAVFLISVLVYLVSLMRGYRQTIFIGVISIIAYPIMGAYGLLASLVVALCSQKTIINGGVAIAVSFVSCMIFYYTHTTVMMSQMIYAALPCLYIAKEWQAVYAVPYIGIVIGLLVPLMVKKIEADKIKVYVTLVVSVLSIGVLLKCNYNNNNFRREIQIYRAIDEGDWYKVLDIVDDSKRLFNPTRQIAFARNIALWRVGKLGDYAFTYTNETQKSRAPFDLSLPQVCGSQQYYISGMPYLAYRWAMETCVSSGWDVEGLKYMIKSAITVGEYRLALRYIEVLKQTLFHKDWAEYYYELAKEPSLIKERDKEIMWVRSLITYWDTLESENGNTTENVYDYYASNNVNDSKAQEFGMISAMIKRDHKLFWERFTQYLTLNRDIKDVPKHYQEAALLMAMLDSDDEKLNLPFSDTIRQNFEMFRRAYEQTEHLQADQQSAVLCSQFGRTYYYYYTLNRGIL
ncbi:MAG: DUF6057 family protein [Bacteroidia bacterium]|nr:DUF6057 family protein [Bacteroidia bacterium]